MTISIILSTFLSNCPISQYFNFRKSEQRHKPGITMSNFLFWYDSSLKNVKLFYSTETIPK